MYTLDSKVENNETGGACNAYGEEKWCIVDFGGETWGQVINWKTQA